MDYNIYLVQFWFSGYIMCIVLYYIQFLYFATFYTAEHRKLGNLTVTVKKTFPSPNALQVLYQRMKYEYEFYYYVKEQFHLLKRKFGLKSQVKKLPSQEMLVPFPVPMETMESIIDEEDNQDDEKWLEDIYKR